MYCDRYTGVEGIRADGRSGCNALVASLPTDVRGI